MKTPAESVASLYALYAKTIAHLGPDGWDPVPADANVTGVTPDECSVPAVKNGVRYSDGLLGPASSDPTASADGVETYWRSLGLDTEITRSANPKNDGLTVHGISDDINAEYKVDAAGSSISIVTACVPGDYTKLIEGVIKHRASQSPQPSTPAP